MDIMGMIEQCAPNVAPVTMRAIVHVESSARPFIIGYKVIDSNKKVYQLERQPRDQQEAITWAQWFIQHGYRFDAGPAQVNSVNFARTGLNASNAFDPCTNLRVGAQILGEEYARASRKYGPGQFALLAAISAYNSGNHTTGFSNGYVAKVVRASGNTPPLALLQQQQQKPQVVSQAEPRNKLLKAKLSSLDVETFTVEKSIHD